MSCETPIPIPAADPVFTADLKLRSCDELSRHGNVRVACARVGVSRSGVYLARRRDWAFAAAWRAALVVAREHVEAVLAERALEGVEEAVFYRGEQIAVRRRFDTRLLLAHLARLDAQCSASDGAAAGEAAADLDLALARLAGFDTRQGPEGSRPGHTRKAAEAAGEQFEATAHEIDYDNPDDYDPDGEPTYTNEAIRSSEEQRIAEEAAWTAAQARRNAARGRAARAAEDEAGAEWDAFRNKVWRAVDKAIARAEAGHRGAVSERTLVLPDNSPSGQCP